MSTVSSLTNTSSGASSAASSSTSSSSSDTASYESQYQMFLQILTTELQNQDPTSPMDTSQFTSQLAQFSQLEQQLKTNSNLDTLISAQTAGSTAQSVNYIGHTVEATGDSLTLDSAGDEASLTYSLPSTASSATVSILDSTGATVRTFSGGTASGNNTVSFDGEDSQGNELAAGTYTFQVTATDSSGTAINATTYMTGTVTGVDNTNSTINLHIGNQTVPASSVVQVTA